MSHSAPHADEPNRLLSLYAMAVRLYPGPFREAYGASLKQTFRDALDDRTFSHRTLIPLVLRDLATSLVKEHFLMLRDTFGRPALIFNALVLAGLATVLALALNTIPQQVLRLGANDPQIQMATDLAAALSRFGVMDGLRQGALSNNGSGGVVDMSKSLAPFLIVYDNQGRPVGSTAQLGGQTPTPPAGVFDYVRQHGEERVSWQPVLGNVRGVRVAAVVERVEGAQPGFVLAGRNMREVEAREHLVGQLAALAWLAMLGLIFVATAVFGWFTRPRGLQSAVKAG
jgi:hypothetical protein